MKLDGCRATHDLPLAEALYCSTTETPFVKFEVTPGLASRCHAWKRQVCPAMAWTLLVG